jgi:hypothetical protein
MAQQRSRGRQGSTKTKRGNASNRKSGARANSNEGKVDPQLHGREPSGEPDVFVDIKKVKVDEVYVDVEQLEAHLALRAKLANLLQVVAGVHVHLGKVEVDIKGVEAQALLKVRLENLYDILDRALTTLDENPQILEGLVNTVDDTVGSIGELGQKALGPGGAVTQTLGDVGETAQQALQPGGVASQAVGGLSNTAGQALGPGGAVGQAVGGLGQGLGQAGGGAGGRNGGGSSPLGVAAKMIFGGAKTAASELVPELVGRVKDVVGDGHDAAQGDEADGRPPLGADEIEENRRSRAGRRRRRRSDLEQGTGRGGSQAKRGSKRGSTRSGGKK